MGEQFLSDACKHRYKSHAFLSKYSTIPDFREPTTKVLEYGQAKVEESQRLLPLPFPLTNRVTQANSVFDEFEKAQDLHRFFEKVK
ncbi:hypothetical protein HIM_07339 [Hirsutella minnesotensis 3608]|uniref:Uncharacterized protein n=1 Tax=Hirsutella minnesotensis 3608 TaxID=1043627 RepID=A0A0F7ZN90_9HYPO|nr:hypothetical protein HIM_07339 [Hirsutella minnesotensis 3608]